MELDKIGHGNVGYRTICPFLYLRIINVDISINRHLGKLCRRGHNWKGTGKSIRYLKNDTCCECSRIVKIEYRKTHLQKRYDKVHHYEKVKYKYNKEYKKKILSKS